MFIISFTADDDSRKSTSATTISSTTAYNYVPWIINPVWLYERKVRSSLS